MTSKDVHILILGNYKYATQQGKKDLQIQLRP